MSEHYYVAGPERASRVRALFDRIAPRYDLVNDLQSFGLHRLWKKNLLQLANIQPVIQTLDVCCGTGDLALSMAAAGAQVIGCDFSSRMLEAAGERAKRLPLRRPPKFIQADALVLPAADEIFDIVTIGYGLRNLADLEKGIAELLRVLKPGGQLLILDFGKPRNRAWRSVYFTYLRAVVPLFGLVFCGDAAAYSYIVESLLHYPAQEGVTRLLNERGCEVQLHEFLCGVMSIHRAVKPASLRERNDVPLVSRDFVR